LDSSDSEDSEDTKDITSDYPILLKAVDIITILSTAVLVLRGGPPMETTGIRPKNRRVKKLNASSSIYAERPKFTYAEVVEFLEKFQSLFSETKMDVKKMFDEWDFQELKGMRAISTLMTEEHVIFMNVKLINYIF
jgi:hypothetical protein